MAVGATMQHFLLALIPKQLFELVGIEPTGEPISTISHKLQILVAEETRQAPHKLVRDATEVNW
jgi:hypothetical protein